VWLPLIGLLLGILIGLLSPVEIPLGYVKYTAIAILAAIDTIRAQLEARFDLTIFLSGFIINAGFAALLAGLGDLLGLDLYLGAVIAFSIRILDNVGFIRRDLLDVYFRRVKRARDVTG